MLPDLLQQCLRLNTLPGAPDRVSRVRSSIGVSATGRPRLDTSAPAASITRSPGVRTSSVGSPPRRSTALILASSTAGRTGLTT